MLKEYTTRKIIELSEECGHDKKWMKRLWIPKKQGEEQVQSHLKPCRMLGASHEKENKKMEKITEKDCFRSRKECFDDDNCSKCPIWIKEQKQGEEQVQSHLKPCRILGVSHGKERRKNE